MNSELWKAGMDVARAIYKYGVTENLEGFCKGGRQPKPHEAELHESYAKLRKVMVQIQRETQEVAPGVGICVICDSKTDYQPALGRAVVCPDCQAFIQREHLRLPWPGTILEALFDKEWVAGVRFMRTLEALP